MTNCSACLRRTTCKECDYTKFVQGCKDKFLWDEDIEPTGFCEEEEPEEEQDDEVLN